MLGKANQRRKQPRFQLFPLEEVLEFNQNKLLKKDRKNENLMILRYLNFNFIKFL